MTDIFIICFSTISRASFENVKSKWMPELHKHSPGVPIILIGTKTDIRDDEEILKKFEVTSPVFASEAEQLVKQSAGLNVYAECSALTQDGLKGVFDITIRTALEKPNQKSSTKCFCKWL